jgi:NADPH:quinone reductase-like Zn-dependent oxidoreductase
MKAVQVKQYGNSSVIEVTTNAPKPTVKPGQVLVENYAASINPIDWKVREGFLNLPLVEILLAE